MSTRWRHAAGLLAWCALLSPAVLGRDWYVATTGNDSWDGSSGSPLRNIKTAISRAASGDTIRVRQGTYNESYIQVKSGLTILSEDGLYAAKVNAGTSTAFRFEGSSSTNRVTNAEVRGFECYATFNGGSSRDGLVRVLNATNIRIKDCKIRDAPNDADVVKIGGASQVTDNVLLENCVIYNPAPRSGDLSGASGWQENIDIYPASYVTIRHCWIYHTSEVPGNTLLYCKGGSANIIYENNIFGPVNNCGYNDPSVSIGAPSPYSFPSAEFAVVRNNLFLSCGGYGAFGMISARYVEFYNNLIWNYNGPGGAVLFYYVQAGLPRNDGFTSYNNIIMNTNGRVAYFDRNGVNTPTNLLHDYNVYYNTGGGGAVNIGTEPHSLFVNPNLLSPSAPVPGTDTWTSIVARFRPLPVSAIIDAGINLGSLVPTDINGVTRPIDQSDMGPYEVLVGDVTADGHVDDSDLLIFVDSWAKSVGEGGCDASCDFNADYRVDVSDLLKMAANWGR
jgi:hypothetical protein